MLHILNVLTVDSYQHARNYYVTVSYQPSEDRISKITAVFENVYTGSVVQCNFIFLCCKLNKYLIRTN